MLNFSLSLYYNFSVLFLKIRTLDINTGLFDTLMEWHYDFIQIVSLGNNNLFHCILDVCLFPSQTHKRSK